MTAQERIINICKFCKKFGVNYNGLRFLMNRKAYTKHKIITFSSEKLAYPIYFRGNNADFTIFDQIFLDDSYSIDFGFQPKVIFDCGANVGFAAVFFKNQFPDSKIVCVEPDSSNYEMLGKNTENFKNVILYNAGLWNKSSHLIIENPTADKYGLIVKEVDKASSESIKAVTLKEIMEEQKIDFIDILKIDIEGSEKEVFMSNYEYWLPRTRVIIIELHDNLKEGCSKAFFEALVKQKDFRIGMSGENIICFMDTDLTQE